MSIDFLSGLLLALVVLGTVGYIVKELLADRAPGAAGSSMKETVARHLASEAKPVNEHLIGTAGAIVAHTDDSNRPMQVRLGSELWAARAVSAPDGRLPIGTEIVVTAIDGPVVTVERHDDSEEPPDDESADTDGGRASDQ